jgi:hypothetical protein
MLDTGDILFMEHICHKTFSLREFFYCYKNKAVKKIGKSLGVKYSDWDGTGVLIREKRGPRVLFNFAQKLYDLEYEEVLRMPFFNDISVRKMRTVKPEIGTVGNEFRAMVHTEIIERQKLEWVYQLLNPVEIAIKYWKKTELLDGESIKSEAKMYLEDIDRVNPRFLDRKKASYSEPIILRTFMSRLETENIS